MSGVIRPIPPGPGYLSELLLVGSIPSDAMVSVRDAWGEPLVSLTRRELETFLRAIAWEPPLAASGVLWVPVTFGPDGIGALPNVNASIPYNVIVDAPGPEVPLLAVAGLHRRMEWPGEAPPQYLGSTGFITSQKYTLTRGHNRVRLGRVGGCVMARVFMLQANSGPLAIVPVEPPRLYVDAVPFGSVGVADGVGTWRPMSHGASIPEVFGMDTVHASLHELDVLTERPGTLTVITWDYFPAHIATVTAG